MIGRLRFNTGNASGSGSSNGGNSIFSGIVTGTGLSIIGSSSSKASNSTANQETSASFDENEDDLPPGWRLVSSRHSGRDYYLHIATGHTQWEKPTVDTEVPKVAVPPKPPSSTSTNVTNVLSSGVSRMGAGLTSMFTQANNRLQTTLQQTTTTHKPPSSSSKSQPVEREGQVLVEIFENERLAGRLQPDDPKKFSDREAAAGTGYEELPDGDLPEGFEWTTEWEIDTNYTSVDRDGWTYASDFVEIVRLLREDLSHASRHPNDAVRRRRWIRYRQLQQESSSPKSTDDASMTSSSWQHPDESVDHHKPPQLSESSSSMNEELDDHDDPFHRTAQKQQTGFRVNMKFPHRGGKDNTKDYQSINLSDVMWLVNAQDVAKAPSDELMREQTANLEEQIKEATVRSKTLERALRQEHETKSKELTAQQKKLDALITQYRKIQQENDALQQSVVTHRNMVESLRKEATEKDIVANEEQRAINAELSAANHVLEEKAKALATARMRYKRDNKALLAAVEEAKARLEQQRKAKDHVDAQDPITKELKTEMDKVRQVHAKLEAVRQHRLILEEESKTLFNLVVEKKADLKFQSKQKLETALQQVDDQLKTLKEEQAALTKSLAQKPEGDALRKLNARRNDIRSELGALKERRTMLLAEKRKQEGTE